MNARIEKYLTAYNAIQFLGWSASLLCLFWDFGYAFAGISLMQTLSIAEIFHAYKKWSRSPLLYTFLQIAARLLILYLLYKLLMFSIFHPLPYLVKTFYILFGAWSVAEIIRYGYYLSLLLKKENKTLTWLRYSAFIICYPLGLAAEMYIIYLFYRYASYQYIRTLLILVWILYAIAFPMLYLHLLKQRRKKLIHNS